MLETSEVECIGSHDVQFGFLSHRCGVKIRFHAPIVAKGNIILRFCLGTGNGQYHEKYNSTCRHVIITIESGFYCDIYSISISSACGIIDVGKVTKKMGTIYL